MTSLHLRPAAAPGGAVPSVRLSRQHRHWVVSWGGRRAVTEDLVGVRHLALLLARPGVPVPALQLAGAGGPPPWDPSRQAVLDGSAAAAYRDRARRLVAELAEARDRSDRDRVARLEEEADALAAELERSVDARGRSREFAGPAERARVAVRKAIKRALEHIAEADPAIGRELLAAVSTGHTCCYRPTGADPGDVAAARLSRGRPAARARSRRRGPPPGCGRAGRAW